MLYVVIAVVVLVVLGLLADALFYNGLVKLRNKVEAAWAQIDVQLTRRAELIPNLVETVKGYAAHEKETLDAVIRARNSALQAESPHDKAEAENVLTGALKSVFALSEAYPDLKANANFQQLQMDLSDIENKLAAARRFFNNAVAEFNAVRRQFPTVLFAALVGFGSDEPFFDVGEGERAALNAAPPTVKF